MEYDLHSNVNAFQVVPPEALAVNTNGAAIDTLGFEGLVGNTGASDEVVAPDGRRREP